MSSVVRQKHTTNKRNAKAVTITEIHEPFLFFIFLVRKTSQSNNLNRAINPSIKMEVEQCYTGLRRGTEEDRANSSLVGIRSCNNFVKAVAFTRFVPKEYPVRVFDWACGKGGDFFKFTQIFPSMEAYTGIDVTRKSIDDFFARVDRKLPGGLEFRLDVQDLRTFSPHVRIPFYTVSCQFAFHYFCETPESVQSVLQRMASVLAVGGRIIITTPQPDQIIARLRPIGPTGRKELRIVNPDTLELKCRVVTVPT
jgi:SAM-dependent methyltransferase